MSDSEDLSNNPYWHPEVKTHVVKTDEVRYLVFEVHNIVLSSMTLCGMVDPDNEDDEPTLVEALHYNLAEMELSTKVLKIAVAMRTADDSIGQPDGHEGYIDARSRIDKAQGFCDVFEPKGNKSFGFRDVCNKIIHAQDVRPVYDKNDDLPDERTRWGMSGTLELAGTAFQKPWSIGVSLIPFLEAVLELLYFIDESYC
jgi:hypothetical protein